MRNQETMLKKILQLIGTMCIQAKAKKTTGCKSISCRKHEPFRDADCYETGKKKGPITFRSQDKIMFWQKEKNPPSDKYNKSRLLFQLHDNLREFNFFSAILP